MVGQQCHTNVQWRCTGTLLSYYKDIKQEIVDSWSTSHPTWHRYAKRTIGWSCPSSSRCKEVQGQLQRERGRALGTMCVCEIERGTHACKASKLGPVERWWTQDGKLWITIQDTPPRVWKTDTSIVFYLFVLHSITFMKTCHFAACFMILWTSISVFYVKTRDVVTVLLIFAKYSSFYLHIFTCTYRRTHTSTHVQYAHKRNGDNQAQEPGWERREKGCVRDLTTSKKNVRKTRYSRIKRKDSNT